MGLSMLFQAKWGWEHCHDNIFWGIISSNVISLHDFQLAIVCLPAQHCLLYTWKWSALIGWLILQAGHMIDETPHGENPSRGEFCTDLVLAIFQCFNEKIRYFWIGPARYGSVNAISAKMTYKHSRAESSSSGFMGVTGIEMQGNFCKTGFTTVKPVLRS